MTMNKNNSLPYRIPFWGQVFIWVGLLGLLALIAFALLKSSSPILSPGSQIPDFALKFYEGYEFNGQADAHFSDFRGKVVLINFWASWCKPCESEAADLESAWRSYQSNDEVVFIGLDYVDTEPEARSYLAKFDITYPNAPDLGTFISQIFNRNLGVPETYIIDQKGILRFIKIGPFSTEEEVHVLIDSILTGE